MGSITERVRVRWEVGWKVSLRVKDRMGSITEGEG